MKISYEMRVKQRLIILRLGKFLVTKMALLLGIVGFMLTIFPGASRFSLVLAGLAAATASFGTIFAIIFSKIGWSDNLLVDALFNQTSIIMAMASFLTGLFYIGFFIISGIGYSFLLVACIMGLVFGMILMALGRQLSSIPR